MSPKVAGDLIQCHESCYQRSNYFIDVCSKSNKPAESLKVEVSAREDRSSLIEHGSPQKRTHHSRVNFTIPRHSCELTLNKFGISRLICVSKIQRRSLCNAALAFMRFLRLAAWAFMEFLLTGTTRENSTSAAGLWTQWSAVVVPWSSNLGTCYASLFFLKLPDLFRMTCVWKGR